MLRIALLTLVVAFAPMGMAEDSTPDSDTPDKDKSKEENLEPMSPWENPDEIIKEGNKAVYERLEGPSRKRNVSDIENLFDWEHIKPFETPYDKYHPHPGYDFTFKNNALLGSWSIESRFAALTGVNDNNDDAMSFFARVRFGPLGFDFTQTEFEGGAKLESLTAIRATVDFDIYEWLNFRPAFGYSEVGFKNNAAPGLAFGAELELYIIKPFSFEIHMQEHSNDEFDRLREGYVGVGFFPTLIFSDNPTFFPEFRFGWRRLVTVARSGINDNFLVFEVALEF